jgi:putative membrane protein
VRRVGHASSPWSLIAPALHPIALVILLLAGWRYLTWVRRLSARGRRWPVGRALTFGAGLVVLAVATQTGVATIGHDLFSVHATQHVLIGMVAPVLLALGAPVTLALQAGSARTRLRLRRSLGHPAGRVLTNPLLAFALFGGSLFVVYFTGIYELAQGNDLVHEAVHVHFLLAGTLFAVVVIGVDAMPGRLPHPGRLLLVLLTVPVHAVLGLALLTAKDPIGTAHDALDRPSWAGSLLGDQRTGAGIMWIAGELFGLVVAGVVVAQWMRHAEREARRIDRALDRAEAEEAARAAAEAERAEHADTERRAAAG